MKRPERVKGGEFFRLMNEIEREARAEMARSNGGSAATPRRTYLPPEQEAQFQQQYASDAQRLGLDQSPDAPGQRYDYRSAFMAGAGPNEAGHWPSDFKDIDHPTRYQVDQNGITYDTATDRDVPAAFAFMNRDPLADYPTDPREVSRLQGREQARAAGQRAARAYSPLPDELGWAVPPAAVLGDVAAAGGEMLTTGQINPARRERWARGTEQAGRDVLDSGHAGELMDALGEIGPAWEADNAARAEQGMGPRNPVLSVTESLWRGWPEAGRDARARAAEADATADFEARDATLARDRGEQAFPWAERVARDEADRAYGDDFWTTGPAAAEFIPGGGFVSGAAGSAGRRLGVVAPRIAEEAPGPLTQAGRNFRNDAMIGAGATGVLLSNPDGQIDPLEGAALGALTAQFGPRYFRSAVRELGGDAAPARLGDLPEGALGIAPARPNRMLAAIRDPETGQVYTGANHFEAIDAAPPEAQPRLGQIYEADMNGPDVGFQRGEEFLSREQAMARLGDAASGTNTGPPLRAPTEQVSTNAERAGNVAGGQSNFQGRVREIADANPELTPSQIFAQIATEFPDRRVRDVTMTLRDRLRRTGVDFPRNTSGRQQVYDTDAVASRAGQTAPQIAQATGIPVESVRRIARENGIRLELDRPFAAKVPRNEAILRAVYETNPARDPRNNLGGRGIGRTDQGYHAIARRLSSERGEPITASMISGVVKRHWGNWIAENAPAPEAAPDPLATQTQEALSRQQRLSRLGIPGISARRNPEGSSGIINPESTPSFDPEEIYRTRLGDVPEDPGALYVRGGGEVGGGLGRPARVRAEKEAIARQWLAGGERGLTIQRVAAVSGISEDRVRALAAEIGVTVEDAPAASRPRPNSPSWIGDESVRETLREQPPPRRDEPGDPTTAIALGAFGGSALAPDDAEASDGVRLGDVPGWVPYAAGGAALAAGALALRGRGRRAGAAEAGPRAPSGPTPGEIQLGIPDRDLADKMWESMPAREREAAWANRQIGRSPLEDNARTLGELDDVAPPPSGTYRARGEQRPRPTAEGLFPAGQSLDRVDYQQVLRRINAQRDLTAARGAGETHNVEVLARQYGVRPVRNPRTGKVDRIATLRRIFSEAGPTEQQMSRAGETAISDIRLGALPGARASDLRARGLWAVPIGAGVGASQARLGEN